MLFHVSLLAQWGALGVKVLGILSALTMVVSNTILRYIYPGGSPPGVSWQRDEASGPCLVCFWGNRASGGARPIGYLCPMTSSVPSLQPWRLISGPLIPARSSGDRRAAENLLAFLGPAAACLASAAGPAEMRHLGPSGSSLPNKAQLEGNVGVVQNPRQITGCSCGPLENPVDNLTA